jgi:hypothetical protein
LEEQSGLKTKKNSKIKSIKKVFGSDVGYSGDFSV